jgi:hypothetical protein
MLESALYAKILTTNHRLICFSLLWLTMTTLHGQSGYEAHMLAFERLNQTYATEEYSAINRQLAFPTSVPNLPQRTDETKATKLQIQALNNWQREFDIRLQKIIDDQKKFNSSNALVYQDFANKVSSVYGKLKRKEFNFGNANQALIAAQATLVLDPEITPKPSPQALSSISSSAAQPSQTKLPPNSPVELPKKATLIKNVTTSSKAVCDQKSIELEALRLEEENWFSVTASLNQVIKQLNDREMTEQAQDVQSHERQTKIAELTSFRTKNCKP